MQYIDIQVNGFAGVSFIDRPPTMAQVRHVASRLAAGNVRAILPTAVTDAPARMIERLRNFHGLISQDASLRAMMPAFHIEGPCISPLDGYRGAHPAEHIQPASRALLEPLIEAAGGPDWVAIVTLAPEHDRSLAVTHWLAGLGIHVAAGHTDAPLPLLREAVDAGLTMFTHLGNGCAAQMHRHDNIINRALTLPKITYSLVPDGHHVPMWLLRQWIDALGHERFVFTTDCVEAAGAAVGYQMGGIREIDYTGETPITRLKGTPYLAGAAITMAQGHQHAAKHLGLSEGQLTDMWEHTPARLLARWLAPPAA